MKKLNVIEKLQNSEISFKETLEILSTKLFVWEFEYPDEFNITEAIPGCLAIHVLRKALSFFPNRYNHNNRNIDFNPKKLIEKRLSCLDITMSKILNELNSERYDPIQEEEEEGQDTIKKSLVDNQKYNMFRYSRTYNFLFEYIFKIFCLVKTYVIYKEVRDENTTNTKNMLKHVKDLVFYSRAFKFFFCDIFNVYNTKCIYIKISNRFNKTQINFQEIFDLCEPTKHFYLDLTAHFLKYSLSEVDLFTNKYKNRLNLTINTINNISKRYIHLLWKLFERKYPKIFTALRDIQSKKFEKFIKKVLGIMVSDDSLQNRFSVLYFDFLVGVYFSKIMNMGLYWDTNFKCMDINQFEEMDTLSHYPLIFRLCETLWGVSYNGTIYFGDIFQTYLKFKDIIINHHNGFIVYKDEITNIEKKINIVSFLN